MYQQPTGGHYTSQAPYYEEQANRSRAHEWEGKASGFDSAALTVDYDAPLTLDSLDSYQQTTQWSNAPGLTSYSTPNPPPHNSVSAPYDPYDPAYYPTHPYVGHSATTYAPFQSSAPAPAPVPPPHSYSTFTLDTQDSGAFATEFYDPGYEQPYQHDWMLETVDEVYNPRAPFLFETTPARYHPPTYPLLEAPIDTYYPPPPPPLSQPVFDPPSRPTSSIYRSPPLAPHVLANVASSRIRTSSQPPSAIYRARHSPDYDPLPTAASAPNTPPRQGRPGTHRAQSHQDVPVLSKESLASLHRAVSDRTLHHALASPLQETATRSSSVTSARPKGVGKYYITRGGGSAKSKMDVSTICYTCGDSIGRLVLRGPTIEQMVPRLSATCVNCVPLVDSDTSSPSDASRASKSVSPRPQDTATYFDTMSAAIDALEGVQISEELKGRPVDGPQPELPEDLKGQALTCDVCARIVGAGTVRAHVEGRPTTFTTEVICTRCDEMYQPCSDCGGGGGRLTPGRWRCKELFPNGRKTCNLSHARTPTVEEIDVEVFLVQDVPEESLPALEARCRQLYFNTRLGMLARPEYLSKGDGLATTYAQAERTTVDSWGLMKPLMRKNPDPLMRRYIGLYYSTPQRRRARSANDPPPKSDRVVTGFYLFEHDVLHGTTFYAVCVPWTTSGTAFHCNTKLGEYCATRVKADLVQLNYERATLGLPRYPSLSVHFLVAPFKSDSRITQTLERRGYIALEDFLVKYPDTDLDGLPPRRSIWIPQQFLGAWTIHVLRIANEDDLGSPPVRTRRRKPKKE